MEFIFLKLYFRWWQKLIIDFLRLFIPIFLGA